MSVTSIENEVLTFVRAAGDKTRTARTGVTRPYPPDGKCYSNPRTERPAGVIMD